MKSLFVTGTDTGVGKTLVSAVLVRALNAAYWKPVQSGDLDFSDTDRVRQYCGGNLHSFPEAYRLREPISPHASAALDGVHIQTASIAPPEHDGWLVVEGAGGLMVPLNDEELYADWLAAQGLPVVLVSLNRLGSINHTLLSVEGLLNRNLEILGLVFNGEPAPTSESFILSYTELPCLGRIPWTASPDAAFVETQAAALRPALLQALGQQQP